MKLLQRSEQRERGVSATASTKTTSTCLDEYVTPNKPESVFTPVRLYHTHARRNYGLSLRQQKTETDSKNVALSEERYESKSSQSQAQFGIRARVQLLTKSLIKYLDGDERAEDPSKLKESMKNALIRLEDLPLVNCSLIKEFIVVLFTTVKIINDFSKQ